MSKNTISCICPFIFAVVQSGINLCTIQFLPDLHRMTRVLNAVRDIPKLSRKLKSRFGARNRFQEPSLELSSQAT
jgi:hypothetical protein